MVSGLSVLLLRAIRSRPDIQEPSGAGLRVLLPHLRKQLLSLSLAQDMLLLLGTRLLWQVFKVY